MTYRLGGGRSIQLSYGAALRHCLLFLAREGNPRRPLFADADGVSSTLRDRKRGMER